MAELLVEWTKVLLNFCKFHMRTSIRFWISRWTWKSDLCFAPTSAKTKQYMSYTVWETYKLTWLMNFKWDTLYLCSSIGYKTTESQNWKHKKIPLHLQQWVNKICFPLHDFHIKTKSLTIENVMKFLWTFIFDFPQFWSPWKWYNQFDL